MGNCRIRKILKFILVSLGIPKPNLMRKLFFTLAFLASFIIDHAQSLNNTSWALYEGLQLVTHAHFVDGLFSVGTNLDELDDIATYTEYGNEFTVTDLDLTTGCDGFIGQYTFEMSNDTLIFSTVVDSCESRNEAFIDFVWVGLVTGIKTVDLAEAVTIYPNPATDIITIEFIELTEPMEYSILDISGKRLMNGLISSELETIEVNQLEPGVYFIDFGPAKLKPIKFLKQ